MKSKWSHSALVAGPFLGQTALIETSDFHVTVNDLERYIQNPNVSIEVRRPPVSAEVAYEAVKKAYRLNGQMYGYEQLLSFGVKALLARVKIKIRNFFRGGLVCCHVIFYAYEETGISIDVPDPEDCNTEDLYFLSQDYELIYSKEFIK
jgi:hypothetical protein